MNESAVYPALNKAWKNTTRILFGEELGELRNYKDWLGEYLPVRGKRNSHISGKEVILAVDHYSPNARFISADEVTEKTVEPLTINEVKDIDSIAEALRDKWEYTGNKVLGNSKHIESSDAVMDSQYVLDSTDIQQSTYISDSFMTRTNMKYAFGSGWGGTGEFIVRGIGISDVSRILDSMLIGNSSDVYFSFYCMQCNDVLFSFFQRNKRNCIGNLELPRDRYVQLKKKILGEIAEELKRSKRFPSLFELVSDKKPAGTLKISSKKENTNMAAIEKAFSSTFKVIFRKKAENIDQYENWLSKYNIRMETIKTPFGHETYLPEGKIMRHYAKAPRNRIVTLDEGMELGKRHLDENALTSLEKICDNLHEIGYFTTEIVEGNATNNIIAPLAYFASNNYKTYDVSFGEYAAMDSIAVMSKYTFGCYRIVGSQFCINCHNSFNLSRCFEMDTSTKCSDSMFCHNSEGLSDCMFCFNTKGKRNAIGNTQLAPDKYRAIKDSVIEQLANELETKKDLRWDIYNLIEKRGKKLWHNRLTE